MNNSENVNNLINGVEKLCSTVALTLGPKGRNVVINQNGTPVITNDGVTIAKAFKCENKTENLGCEIAKQASIQTNQIAGDGTTTALVLTKSLITNGKQLLSEKVNPVALKEGMQLACNKVCELIKKQAVKVKDNSCLKQVAKLSCGNEQISTLVAEAFSLVGKNGVVCMEDSALPNCKLTLKKGFQLNFGLVSPYFLNQADCCKFENAKIMVSSTKLNNLSLLVNVLEQCHNTNSALVIFAPSFSEELIKNLIVNKLNNYLNIALISVSTSSGELENISQDLCALTGATLINMANIENLTFEMLGNLESFESNQNTSTLTNNNTPLGFNEYVNGLTNQLQNTFNEFEKLMLQKRISMLTTGVAVISVGASTEIEQTELKLRIEDAIESTKNALKDGIVCGGGMALYKCKKKLKSFVNNLSDANVKMGAMLVLNCLDKPIIQLAQNCGVNPEKLLKKINNSLPQKPNYCFNANTNKCVTNAYISGIVDATCVPITALTSAVSVTATLLSTVAVVC